MTEPRPKPSDLWSVGQPCLRERRSPRGRLIELVADKVAKVGGKWVTLESGGHWAPYRFNAWTRCVEDNDFMNPERVWRDRAEFERHEAAAAAFAKLREAMRYNRPPPIGLDPAPVLALLDAIAAVPVYDED